MSSDSDPAVETLTAEIRVLQVGSKPVTLSAARQLDHVDDRGIKPFGRVRIDPRPGNMIEVIGSADGILARSSATFREVVCPGYMTTRLPGGPSSVPHAVCPDHQETPAPAGRVSAEQHTWTDYAPSKELYDAWEKLPLIVLAGLR